ncbi:MAG: WD40 repeat domain-containing protein [Synechococcaceae cyanobacterium]
MGLPGFAFQPERPGAGQAPASPRAPASTPATASPRSWIAALQGHTNSVNSVAFSPDGSRLVSGSDDNTLRLWNAATGKPILFLR